MMNSLKMNAAFLLLLFGVATTHPIQKIMIYKSPDSHYTTLVEDDGIRELQVWSTKGNIYQVVFGERHKLLNASFTWDWELLPGMTLVQTRHASDRELPIRHYLSLLGCSGKSWPTVSSERQGSFVYNVIRKKYSNCDETLVKSISGTTLYTRVERTDISHEIMHTIVDP